VLRGLKLLGQPHVSWHFSAPWDLQLIVRRLLREMSQDAAAATEFRINVIQVIELDFPLDVFKVGNPFVLSL
jgi:hypothetical protein